MNKLSKNPLVSIILPVYNNSLVILDTINSLRAQTYQYWEAIFVDDGSTDESYAIIEKERRIDDRIKILKRTELPKGGSHCRNIGINAASGEYIVFLDGDDLLIPTCLEKRLSIITKGSLDFIVFPTARFQDGQIGSIVNDNRITDYLSAFASNHAVWQTTSPIYRTDFIKKLGGFDIGFLRMQDVEMGLRAIVYSNNNFQVIKDAAPDSLYRIGNSATTAEKYNVGLLQFNKFLNLIFSLKDHKGFPCGSKFSRVLLCLSLSALNVYLVPSRLGSEPVIRREEIFVDIDFLRYMTRIDIFIYKSVSLFSNYPRLQYQIIRIVRRLLLDLSY